MTHLNHLNFNSMMDHLDLNGGRLIHITDSGFSCRCRFSHVFVYDNITDWCNICKTSDFQASLISELNSELSELSSPFHIFKVNKYGYASSICTAGHADIHDMDNIPNKCIKCLELTNMFDALYIGDTSECMDTSSPGFVYDTNDSLDDDMSDCESCCDDWFTKWDNLSDDDTGESLEYNIHQQNIFYDFDLEEQSDNISYVTKVRTSEFRTNNIVINTDYVCNIMRDEL
jgi:hypothetical protein